MKSFVGMEKGDCMKKVFGVLSISALIYIFSLISQVDTGTSTTPFSSVVVRIAVAGVVFLLSAAKAGVFEEVDE